LMAAPIECNQYRLDVTGLTPSRLIRQGPTAPLCRGHFEAVYLEQERWDSWSAINAGLTAPARISKVYSLVIGPKDTDDPLCGNGSGIFKSGGWGRQLDHGQ